MRIALALIAASLFALPVAPQAQSSPPVGGQDGDHPRDTRFDRGYDRRGQGDIARQQAEQNQRTLQSQQAYNQRLLAQQQQHNQVVIQQQQYNKALLAQQNAYNQALIAQQRAAGH